MSKKEIEHISKTGRKEDEKDKKFREIVDALKTNNFICYISYLSPFVHICPNTIRNWYPKGTARRDVIEGLLETNRAMSSIKIGKKIEDSANVQGLIYLHKVLCTDEERQRIKDFTSPSLTELDKNGCNSNQEEQDIEGSGQSVTECIAYLRNILKDANRYSPMLEGEILSMASAMSTLNAANRVIDKLPSPFIEETTTQGRKIKQHPVFKMQQDALEGMARHSKLLGIDFGNVPDMATEGPLVSLTKEMIGFTKAQKGHMSVDKAERKTSKKEPKRTQKEPKKEENEPKTTQKRPKRGKKN